MGVTGSASSDATAAPESPTLRVHRVRFRDALAWAMVGNLVYAACQWGALVVLARAGGPAMVGEFSFGLALAGPVFMLTNLQLAGLLATDAGHVYPFTAYRAVRSWSVVAGCLGSIGLGLAMGVSHAGLLTLIALTVAKGSEAISDIHYGLLQRADRMREVAVSQMVRGLGMVLALATVAVIGRLEASAALMCLAWLMAFLFYDRRSSAKYFDPGSRWNVDMLRHLAIAGLPLGITAMLISLNVNLPRLMIERSLGHSALGIYAVMAYVVVGGRMAAIPIAQVAAPRFGRLRAVADREGFQRLLVRLSLAMWVFGIGGLVIAALWGHAFLAAFFGRVFAAESGVLTILMVAAALGYQSTLLQTVAVAKRRLGAQAVLMLLAVATTGIGCTLLIPQFGLRGAAWAVVLAGLVELAGSALLIREDTRPGEVS